MSWFKDPKKEYLLGFGYVSEMYSRGKQPVNGIEVLSGTSEWKKGARDAETYFKESERSRQSGLELARTEGLANSATLEVKLKDLTKDYAVVLARCKSWATTNTTRDNALIAVVHAIRSHSKKGEYL